MKRLFILLSLPLLSALSLHGNPPEADEVIAKAREFLGGDDRLAAIETLRYEGTFETREGATGEVTIELAKPLLQRLTVARDDRVQETVLGAYEGWVSEFLAENPRRRNVAVMDAGRIRELRANTWENLYFYKNIERRRGSVDNLGFHEIDGRETVGLAFNHRGGYTFTRYFDPETGELVHTKTGEGTTLREEGEKVVDGIRFPERVVTLSDGEVVHTVTFTNIEVNPEFPEKTFAFPETD
ncbi:MAG: hypothetical protein JJT75_11525 [Opitutales bacterium]|nr:hypothetical protein [Opitutales bacterium]MCH8539212.1 hypothetical protein [Opitutales bacterium]